MKYAATITIVLAALLQAANADFDLYRVGLGGTGISGNSEGWQVYEQDTANCDSALDWIWRDSDDVSGGKFGVRCEGDGCGRGFEEANNPENIEVLEMNFNREEHHWTYYKEREGYDIGVLVDTSDNQVGTCFPLASEHLDCGLDPVGRVVGPRKLACELADIDAGDINAGRPSKRRAARDFAA